MQGAPGSLPGQPGAEPQVEFFSMENMQNNVMFREYVRTFMGIMSGLVAGVLGVTGWFSGVLCYVLMNCVVNLGMAACMGWDPKGFTNESLPTFLFGDMTVRPPPAAARSPPRCRPAALSTELTVCSSNARAAPSEPTDVVPAVLDLCIWPGARVLVGYSCVCIRRTLRYKLVY